MTTPIHGSGLSRAPAPPPLRFEHKRADSFMVWIAAPPHDLEDVNAALASPETRALSPARALVAIFGHTLTPAEDALLDRYEAQDTGAKFWRDVGAAGLAYTPPAEDLPPVSERTQALARMVGFVAIENTIARSPLVLANKVRRVSGAEATAAEVFVAAFWGALYAKQLPPDGWITATFAATGDVLGYAGHGGWQYDSIRDLVRFMHGCVVPREWVTAEGEERLHTFSVVQDSDVPMSGEGDGTYRVRLGDTYRSRILQGRFQPLEIALIRRARQEFPRNEVAQRMWIFLVTQRLPWPPGWPIFRTPEGQDAGPGDEGRPVAEVFGLYGASHKHVVKRIRAAATIVVAVFPEYTITVKPDNVPTMYRMFATRRAALSPPVDKSLEPVYEGDTAPADLVYEGDTAPCTRATPPQARFEAGQGFKSKGSKSKERSRDNTVSGNLGAEQEQEKSSGLASMDAAAIAELARRCTKPADPPIPCYVCGRGLSGADRETTNARHDRTGWRHTGCKPKRAATAS